jgi:hypothetical protein
MTPAYRWPKPGTDSTPTEPGHYWLRNAKQSSGLLIPDDVYEVSLFAGILMIHDYGPVYVHDIIGEWCRVPEPGEPGA